MKNLILLLIISFLILKANELYLQTMMVTNWVVFLSVVFLTTIKLLNFISDVLYIDHCTINGKNNVKPDLFYERVKGLDYCDKYTISDFTFQTPDGYNLLVFRVNLKDSYKKLLEDQKNINKPVLLLHAMSGSSLQYFISKKSIGFKFVDKGYDLWLLNLRGNIFNYSHANTNISNKDFFDYTIYDQALIDIPTCYENIIKITQHEKIIWCSFSLGGLEFMIASSDEKTSK